MGDLARQYTPSTIKRLFALSGNECAEPNCSRKLIAKDGASIIAKICHIEAASDDGPRFNISMTDDERRHFDNLILLCDEDHTIIDNKENEAKYSKALLKEWKKNHEGRFLYEKIKNNPSLLIEAINKIANVNWEEIKYDESLSSFNPRDKITHNSIKRNTALINDYKIYSSRINSLYDELELQGSFKKEKLLSNIKLIYTKVKGKYVLDSEDPISIIRENSDTIIDEVYEELFTKIEESGVYDEDLMLGLNLIIVDSFMRCKILEEPV
jgi:hypothetical protein